MINRITLNLTGSACAAAACLTSASPGLAQATLDRVAPATRVQVPEVQDKPPPSSVLVSDATSSVPPAGHDISVGAISLNGLVALTPDKFSDIIADYIGRSVQPIELSKLATRIAERMQAAGYVFAVARIAPQRLHTGILVIDVDEGKIGRVELEGSTNHAVLAALAPLADGRPVKLVMLERRLLLAGDIDGIRLGRPKLVRSDRGNALIVPVNQDSAMAKVTLDNDGTNPIGPEQIHIEAKVSQVVFSDDSLTWSYSTTPLRPRELQSGRVRYQKRLNVGGTELSVASGYSRVQPGSYLAADRLRGQSLTQSLALLQPLHRGRRSSLWFTGSLEINQLTQNQAGVLVRKDRETVLRAGLYGYQDLLGGRLRVSTVLSQGLDLFDSTKANDPLASRADATGVFTIANAWFDWTRSLGRGFSVRVAGNSQIASRPLLVGEEMALGGGAFLRGYDISEATGDEGVAGSAELRFDLDRPFGFANHIQLYTFGDGGAVYNLANQPGGTTLASAGGGMRIDFSSALGATAEIAVPLTQPRYDTQNRQPRISVGLAKSF
jgi:hemolysin activation/secretion protein